MSLNSIDSIINAAADHVSFDSDGFTWNWVTADATAREIIAVCFGSNPPAGAAQIILLE